MSERRNMEGERMMVNDLVARSVETHINQRLFGAADVPIADRKLALQLAYSAILKRQGHPAPCNSVTLKPCNSVTL